MVKMDESMNVISTNVRLLYFQVCLVDIPFVFIR